MRINKKKLEQLNAFDLAAERIYIQAIVLIYVIVASAFNVIMSLKFN